MSNIFHFFTCRPLARVRKKIAAECGQDRGTLVRFHLRQLYQLPPDTRTITINQSTIKPETVVRDLGVWFDAELSMRKRVSRVSQTCFYHLRRLRSVRQQLGRDVTGRLVSALVL